MVNKVTCSTGERKRKISNWPKKQMEIDIGLYRHQNNQRGNIKVKVNC